MGLPANRSFADAAAAAAKTSNRSSPVPPTPTPPPPPPPPLRAPSAYRWVYIARRRHVHAFISGPNQAAYDPRTGAHIAATLSGLLLFLLLLIVYHRVRRRFRRNLDPPPPPAHHRRHGQHRTSAAAAVAAAAALTAAALDHRRRRCTYWRVAASVDLPTRHSVLLARRQHRQRSSRTRHCSV